MDLSNIVIDHGERELLDRLQGPMRFVGMFFIVTGTMSVVIGLVDLLVSPALGVFMLAVSVASVMIGCFTRAAGLSFRAASRNQSLPALRDGLSALVRVYRSLRILLLLYVVATAGVTTLVVILARR